jgi:site-specific DNA recombinase
VCIIPGVLGEADTAAYARISLDRHDGAGVDRQLEDIHVLCERRLWGYRDYVDNHRSAWQAGRRRPQYELLLADIRAGRIVRVVVYKTDRLYRQPRELEDLIALADQGRVEIVAVEGGELNLGTSDGRALARVLAAMNAKESDDKADRVRRAKRQARENGEPHGGPRPFGWARRMVARPDGTIRETWDPMAHDQIESDLIRTATTDVLAGASLSDIRRRWRKLRVPQPQTGQPNWTTDAVRQVLSNPRNAGLVGHRVEVKTDRPYRLYARPVVIGEARWPAIVDQETWYQLQSLLDGRAAPQRVPRRRSLLTGLLVCECGATMVRSGWSAERLVIDGEVAGRVVRKAWRCPSREKACGRIVIEAAPLEEILTIATWRRMDQVDLAAIVGEESAKGKEAAALLAQLDALKRREEEAADSYSAGRIGLAMAERISADIERDRRAIQIELGRVTSTGVLQPWIGRPGSLRAAWEAGELTVDQQREIIRRVLGRQRILPAAPGRLRYSFSAERVVPAG